MTEDKGDHLFVPIAAEWLASDTDDDDDDYDDGVGDRNIEISVMMMYSYASTSAVFGGFRPISESDLRSCLSSVNLKSCELYPLPPFIINDILDDLAPVLVYLFNRSLSELLKSAFLPRRSGPLSFLHSKSLTLTPTFAITIGLSQIYPFFLRL